MAKHQKDSIHPVNSGNNDTQRLTTAYENLLSNHNKIKTLYSLSLALSSIHDLTPFLDVVSATAKKHLGADGFALIQFHPDGGELTPLTIMGLDLKLDPTARLEDIPELVHVFKKPGLYHIPDLTAPYASVFRTLLNLDYGEFVGVPLRCVREDRAIGLLLLYHDHGRNFSPNELELIEDIGRLLANALDRISLYQHTKHLSIRDDLTNVFNRRYFNQRYERELQRAKRYKRSVAIIMLDIDHFKIYNDRNGHLLGDMVLRSVAQNLEKILRNADFVARFGGEEFVIMLPEISKEQGLLAADKLRKRIEQLEFPNESYQPSGKLTISQGLAVYPEDAEDPQLLLQYADNALYKAKTMGRNCVAWHGMKPNGAPGDQKALKTKPEITALPG